jgi:hypothetical protein
MPSGYHDVFAAATSKNITLFASSGDEGAAQQTCDGNSWTRAVSSPAGDPLSAASAAPSCAPRVIAWAKVERSSDEPGANGPAACGSLCFRRQRAPSVQADRYVEMSRAADLDSHRTRARAYAAALALLERAHGAVDDHHDGAEASGSC